MHLAVNAELFYRAIGIVDEELEAFQGKLDCEFHYLNNATALRPDQFVAQGGGNGPCPHGSRPSTGSSS
jgi:hypothetical protein